MKAKIIFLSIALLLGLGTLQAQVVGTPKIVPTTTLQDCDTPSFIITKVTNPRAIVNQEFELHAENISPITNTTFVWQIIDPASPTGVPTNAAFVNGINTGAVVKIIADTPGSYRVVATATSNEPNPCNSVTYTDRTNVGVDDVNNCETPIFEIEQGNALTVNRTVNYPLNIASGFTPANNITFNWEVLTQNGTNTVFVGGTTTGANVILNSEFEGTAIVRVTATSTNGSGSCNAATEIRDITINVITPSCEVPQFDIVRTTAQRATVGEDYVFTIDNLTLPEPDTTFEWEVVNNQANVQIISGQTSSVFTVRAGMPGNFRVRLTATNSNTPAPCNSTLVRRFRNTAVEAVNNCETPVFEIEQGNIFSVNTGISYELNVRDGFTPAVGTSFSWEIITQDGTITTFDSGINTGQSVNLTSVSPGNALVRVTATSSATPSGCAEVSDTRDIIINVNDSGQPDCTTPSFTVTRVTSQRATTGINYVLTIPDLEPSVSPSIPVLWEIVADSGTNVEFANNINTGTTVTMLADNPGNFRLRITANSNVPQPCNTMIARDFVNVAVDDAGNCDAPDFSIEQGVTLTVDKNSIYDLNIAPGFTPSNGTVFNWEIFDQGGTGTTFDSPTTGINVSLNSINTGTVVVRATATSTSPSPCNSVTETRDIIITVIDPVNPDCETPVFFITRPGGSRQAIINEDFVFAISNGFTPTDTTFRWSIVNDNGTNVSIIGPDDQTTVTVRATSIGDFRIMAEATSAGTPNPCNPVIFRRRTTTVVRDIDDCRTPDFDIAQGNTLTVNTSDNYNLNIAGSFLPTDATFSWEVINQGGTNTTFNNNITTGTDVTLNSADDGTVVVRVTATSTSPSPCNASTAFKDITITVSDVPLGDCTQPTVAFSTQVRRGLNVEQGIPYTIDLFNYSPVDPTTTFEWTLVNDQADSEIIGSNTGTSVTVRSMETGTLRVRVRVVSNSPSPCNANATSKAANVTVDLQRTGICSNGRSRIQVIVPGIASAMTINCDSKTIHRAVYGHKSITSFRASGSLGTTPYNSQIEDWRWPGSHPQRGVSSLTLTREQMNNFTSVSGTNGFNDPNHAPRCIGGRTPSYYWSASIRYNAATDTISCSATSQHQSCNGHPYDGTRSSNVCTITN